MADDHSFNNYSFSGVDIVPIAVLDGRRYELGNIQTISVSMHRDTSPVRSIGKDAPNAYSQGTRTISGTLVFTKLNFSDWDVMVDKHSAASIGDIRGYPAAERVQKFNIEIHKSNEYSSHLDRAVLRDITIMSGGHTMSIHDVYTEQVYNYVAIEYLDFGKEDIVENKGPKETISNFYEGHFLGIN